MEIFSTTIIHEDGEGYGFFITYQTVARPTSEDVDALDVKMREIYADEGDGDFPNMRVCVRIIDLADDDDEGAEVGPEGEGRKVFWMDEDFHESGTA